MTLAVATLFTRNTLAPAKCLAESVRAAHPEARIFGLLIDRPDEELREAALPFELVELPALGLPDLHHMLFRYTPLEMCCACKPHLLAHVLSRPGVEKALFLDSDILVFSRLDAALAALDTSAVVLTPHVLTSVPRDGKSPDEARLAASGVFNAGFIGVANTSAGRRFLAWWAAPLARECVIDLDAGRYLDQKVLDLAPARFPEVASLRDPGYNVAYWNLHERPVTRADQAACGFSAPVSPGGGSSSPALRTRHGPFASLTRTGQRFFAGDRPLVFFHFSGFDPAAPSVPSRHQDRFRMDQLGAAAELFADYRGRLAAHGHAHERTRHYGFGQYDDGLPVPEIVRRSFRRCGDAWRVPLSPFEGDGPFAFRAWCVRPGDDGAPVMTDVLATRPDLRAAFPDPTGRDRDAAHRWLLAHGAADFGLTFSTTAAPDRPAGPPGFNVLGLLRSEKGVGRAARAVVRALAAAQVPHAPCDWFDPGSANLLDALAPARRAHPHRVNLLAINAVGLHEVDHYFPGYRDGRVNVGIWNWELEVFPEAWSSAFDLLDEVWAPSSFVERAIAARSPVPVRVVPYAVERLPIAGHAPFALPEGRFTFLTSCDLASCLQRKNPLAAIRAFRRAFGLRRDVQLVVKVLGADARPADLAMLVAACGGQPNIRLIDRVLDDAGLGALYQRCDAYVSLHRAEGFGFPLAEAMASGKPVIATAYSGNQDFMTEANSLPVPYRLVPIEEAWGPYPRGAPWAEPDEDAAAAHMLALVRDRSLAARIGDAARAHVAEHLSPARVGALLREHLIRLDPRAQPQSIAAPISANSTR